MEYNFIMCYLKLRMMILMSVTEEIDINDSKSYKDKKNIDCFHSVVKNEDIYLLKRYLIIRVE